MKNRMTIKPVEEFTRPVIAVGMALHKRMIPIGIRGPYLSQKGPNRNRMTIVPVTADIEDDQISSLVRPRVSCTSARSGEIENLR